MGKKEEAADCLGNGLNHRATSKYDFMKADNRVDSNASGIRLVSEDLGKLQDQCSAGQRLLKWKSGETGCVSPQCFKISTLYRKP